MINDRQAIYIHPPSDLSLLRFVTRERGRKLTLRVTWLGLIPETGNHNPSGSRNGILRGERNVNQLRVRRYALWPGKFCQASLIAASLDLRNFRRGQRGSSSSNSSSEGVPSPFPRRLVTPISVTWSLPSPFPFLGYRARRRLNFFYSKRITKRLSNIDPRTDYLRREIIETKRRRMGCGGWTKIRFRCFVFDLRNVMNLSFVVMEIDPNSRQLDERILELRGKVMIYFLLREKARSKTFHGTDQPWGIVAAYV